MERQPLLLKLAPDLYFHLGGYIREGEGLAMLILTEREVDVERLRAEGLQARNELEGRMAELRRTEAELEAVRQAHYDAGDLVRLNSR